MSDAFRAGLGKMLDEYDAARRAVEQSQQQARADDVQFLQRFTELRRDVVRPVFEAGGGLMKARGHGFTISEEDYAVDASGKCTEAGIALHIVPEGMAQPSQADDPLWSLCITTRHYNRSVSIIGGKAAVPGGLAGSRGAYDLSQLNTELVEGELLKVAAEIFKG